MKFSIAIVVKNDRGLKNTLMHLEPQVKGKAEVVVIDASDTVKLDDIKQQFNWVQWHYFVNTTGKRFTIPEQRNMAIKQASGDVIIFVDANCMPQKGWFTAMREAFENDKHQVVAGMVVSEGKKSTYDEGYETRKDGGVLDEAGGANLAVTKKILTKLGGFDTNMTYGEDVDMTWRITDAGHKIVFKKDAIISHDWGTFKDEMRRTFRYGQARMSLYKKHPARWRGLLGIDSIVVIYPLYIVLLPVTFWWPWYPLIILIPMLKNLRNQPIKKTFLHLVYGLGVLKGLFKNV